MRTREAMADLHSICPALTDPDTRSTARPPTPCSRSVCQWACSLCRPRVRWSSPPCAPFSVTWGYYINSCHV